MHTVQVPRFTFFPIVEKPSNIGGLHTRNTSVLACSAKVNYHAPMTLAHELMAEKMAERGMNHAGLAELLGVSRPTVSRLLRAAHTPNVLTALKIERILDVPVALWDQPADVA